MSISTPRDNNRIPTLIGALNTDGVTPVSIKVTSNGVNVSNGTTGTDYPRQNDIKDANRVPAMMGVSSVDGVTPVEIYCDSSGNMLIQST